jgi:hypothetical protein
VVVNDQKPSTININKDGDDDEIANRDESDPSSEVNHAVLLGGVLIAAPPHHNMPGGAHGGSTCRPDCSAARNELCQRVDGHMRCVCRPGFARMFPDRPCKRKCHESISIYSNSYYNNIDCYYDQVCCLLAGPWTYGR